MTTGLKSRNPFDVLLNPTGLPIYSMVGGLVVAFLARMLGPDPSLMRIGAMIACLSFSLCYIGLARIAGWGDRSLNGIVPSAIFLFGAAIMGCMALQIGISDDAWILAHVMTQSR